MVKKVLSLLVCVALALPLAAGPLKVSLSTDIVSFNAETGWSRADLGFLKAGSLSSDHLVMAGLSGHSALWEGKRGSPYGSFSGIALDAGPAVVYAGWGGAPLLGFAAEAAGFDFGVGASFGSDEQGSSLIGDHEDEAGHPSAYLSAGWSNEYVMARGKLSLSDSLGFGWMAAGGVSWAGLTFTYTFGVEHNILQRGETERETWTLSFDGEGLGFEVGVRRFGDPVRPGTYREMEGRAEAELRLGPVRLESSRKARFTSEGEWKRSWSVEASLWGMGIGWSEPGGIKASVERDGVGFWWSDGSFGAGLEMKGDWWKLSLSLDSEGRVDGSLALRF